MPIYTFACKPCGSQTEVFILHTEYAGQMKLGFPGVVCESCSSPEVVRDVVADMQTQYTERAHFYDEFAPDEVVGKGGYSRERKRLLKEAKLVEKGDLPKRRRRVSYTITEADIRKKLAAAE